MTEQRTQSDETQTPSNVDDDVEEATHSTSCERDEADLHADVLAEDDVERYAQKERDLRAGAHPSVPKDWTQHHEDRPPEIHFEVCVHPFSQAEPVNEMEERLLKTVRIREGTIRWTRGDDS